MDDEFYCRVDRKEIRLINKVNFVTYTHSQNVTACTFAYQIDNQCCMRNTINGNRKKDLPISCISMYVILFPERT